MSEKAEAEQTEACWDGKIFVGMPALLHLEQFGSYVWEVFGTAPYLVGSSLRRKDWRDVDVRLILDDVEYAQLFDGKLGRRHTCGKWVALCMAFSALAKQITGLPVDFQIEPWSTADQQYPTQPRYALGIIPLRILPPRDETPDSPE